VPVKLDQSANSAVQWITSFEAAEEILRHKSFREVTFKGLIPLVGQVIVTLEGPAHRERRLIGSKLFTTLRLKAAEASFIIEIAGGAVAQAASQTQAELVRLSYSVMAQIAGRLIGLDGLDSPETAAEATYLLSALVSGTQAHQAGHPAYTRRAARDELRKRFIDPAIARRRNLLTLNQAKRTSTRELPFDLITLLLLHTTQAERKWDTRQIAGEVAFYAVAAIDTTASLVPHLFQHLYEFSRSNPAYPLPVTNPLFIRAAAAEALRLHPAIPTIFRQATGPVKLKNGLTFETGQTAGIYVTQANRDPAIFGSRPDEFKPDRIIRARTRRAGLSFGGGAHLCLGRELAAGTPEQVQAPFEPGDPADDTGLFGVAAILVRALFEHKARPDPAIPIPQLSPFARDVYHTYPVIFG
jgi:cytochrome P450